MREKFSLVLEGGGMRGIYTAGVLDCLMLHKIVADTLVGVSAGAVNGVNYLSKQIGRQKDIILKYTNDPRYMSFTSFLTTGDLFPKDFCYDELPHTIEPFDYETFKNSPTKMFAVVTNLESGKPEYLRVKDLDKDIDVIRASASLPMVSNNVKIGDNEYLDGGIADSIPVMRAVKWGYEKNIVVLTRPRDYKKSPSKMQNIIKLKYRKYPEFVKTSALRYKRYNKTLEKIESLERKGMAFVVAPSKHFDVSRTEKDVGKLADLYELGYKDAMSKISKIREYIAE
ncbi:Predicted phospholipase, patatin/cPLA2 family [Acetitomaculum ruminis DSM 5522]|uniref:Predicted phospholipase, patatin/cPLA2 family n=1 Tax=Acetitomaculum ruminis DSM 5522 TaxID=1120918 RepID=A0A1I0YKL3_9FIRM|nr:patatin family protein [Acetitomaculum ruminis]SFB13447.1 Predicted phospholipase, patatin/cPLA2 family [Acetitomaculum ruminis DSM 5522]